MNLLQALNAPILRNARSPTKEKRAIPAVFTSTLAGSSGSYAAENLSAVYACINIRSSDMACLPQYVFNRFTRKRWENNPALDLLNVRPNARMTPFTRRKLLEYSIYTTGNAYDWILRDPVSREPVELIPLVGTLVQRQITKEGYIWYQVTNPITREVFYLPQEDVCDYKGPSRDGVNGEPILSYARETIAAGLAAQAYNKAFYEHGGQPSGILTVDAPMSGYVKDANGEDTDKTLKEAMREEWERSQAGPTNAHRIAILDYGLKYQSLGISQRDAQFLEQQNQTVEDIARYFNMPLYKLQSGKQSYQSNEQQRIEYVGSLQPDVLQREQEMTYKLLTPSQIARGWSIRTNIMALLRSDFNSRGSFYKTMKENGAYSVNDILAKEDMPDVPGGEHRQASLNYVPLEDWAELSRKRAENGGGGRPEKEPEEEPKETEPEEAPEEEPEEETETEE